MMETGVLSFREEVEISKHFKNWSIPSLQMEKFQVRMSHLLAFRPNCKKKNSAHLGIVL